LARFSRQTPGPASLAPRGYVTKSRSGIKDLSGVSSGGRIAVLKPYSEILVHRSPFLARLYLFSLNPQFSEVTIQKNTEPGRNNDVVSDWNREVIFGNITATEEWRGCAFGHRQVLAGCVSGPPRPQRALAEAIPIAKAHGIVQVVMSGPERIFDIAIISKVPVAEK